MCRMMTPFASEDTLHLKEVSGNMFGSLALSRKFFHSPEDEALLLQKNNKKHENRSLLAFRSIKMFPDGHDHDIHNFG